MNLPSGREINLRRPSFGEVRAARRAHADAGGGVKGKDAFYATLYRLSGLSEQEVNELDAADGLALEGAIDAALVPRKEDQESPFGPSSSAS